MTLHGNQTVCRQFAEGFGTEESLVPKTVHYQVAKAFQPLPPGSTG